jgi:hypothetical protein
MKHHLIVAKEKALERYNNFKSYFDKEIEIIENVGYIDSQLFLDQFPERAKTFILGANRDRTHYSGMEGFPQNIKDDSLVERVLYLSRVADHLKSASKSSKYAPAQGSFWESIGQTLENLALEVQKEL